MQDQGKRLLLAVVLALSVLLLWQKIFPPKEDVPQKPGVGSNANPMGLPTNVQPTSPVGYAGEAPISEPVLISLTYPAFIATFSSVDGALVSWKLTDERYRDDTTHGELVAAPGEFHVGFTKDSTFKLPKHVEWVGTKVNDNQVTYKLTTDQFEIVKTYDIVPQAYVVRLTVQITAKTAATQRLAITNYARQDPSDTGGGSSRVQARVWQSSTLRDGTIVQTDLDSIIEHPRLETNLQWTGFEHPFLLVGFAPKPIPGSPVEKHTYAESNPELAQAVQEFLEGHDAKAIPKIRDAIPLHGPLGLIQTDIVFAPAMFEAGKTGSRELVGYLGPKNFDSLGHADEAAGFSTGFKQVVDLGWFAFLGRPLLWLLITFHGALGNWGISIILLTILVKLVTLYWMTKSMRSMKAMAVLGPQIKELNEKYKGDKQRLQIETMALYKQNGANPLSGCLPMFLQMPIWIALYRMLSSAGELYRQPFIKGWISDLTIADPFYVLPVVLVVTMFAQARLTPQNPDPAQRTQQRIMQYGMPLLFGGMAFVFPAGLTLYIFTNTCLSALHSIYMNKFDKKSMELTARIKAAQEKAAADKAKGTVKGAKDANPKKAEPARPRTSGDDDDDDGNEVAEASAKSAPRVPVRQRPKKKKRR